MRWGEFDLNWGRPLKSILAIFDKKKSDKALKASFGSLLGFFVSASLKFGVGLVYFWFFISSFWEFKSTFF